jgi:hypothetical protein
MATTGLKMMKILNPRKSEAPVIMEYKNFGPEDEQETFLKEMQIIGLRYQNMGIKVNERVPLVSQIDEHKWFLSKDKYGVYYFMLVNDIFEEKYVFKLQKKARTLIDVYYDDLDDEKKAEILSERIEDLVNQYNNALSKNSPAGVLISPDQSEETIKLRSFDNPVFEPPKEGVEKSIDPEDVFVKEDKRNERVKLLQLISLIAVFLAVVLAILQIVMFFKK